MFFQFETGDFAFAVKQGLVAGQTGQIKLCNMLHGIIAFQSKTYFGKIFFQHDWLLAGETVASVSAKNKNPLVNFSFINSGKIAALDCIVANFFLTARVIPLPTHDRRAPPECGKRRPVAGL